MVPSENRPYMDQAPWAFERLLVGGWVQGYNRKCFISVFYTLVLSCCSVVQPPSTIWAAVSTATCVTTRRTATTTLTVFYTALLFCCTATLDYLGCTFDSGLCNYTQDTNDNFDWQRQHGATGSTNTGPRFDHTQGNNAGTVQTLLSTPTLKYHTPTSVNIIHPVLFVIVCVQAWLENRFPMYGFNTLDNKDVLCLMSIFWWDLAVWPEQCVDVPKVAGSRSSSGKHTQVAFQCTLYIITMETSNQITCTWTINQSLAPSTWRQSHISSFVCCVSEMALSCM
jgi:hypothetical protein